MINRISLLAAGLTVLFLPLQPRAAAAERFTPLTVGGITLDREDFNEVLGSDTRPDTTAMRLFEEYALRLAAAAAAGYDLRLRDRSSEAIVARHTAVALTDSRATDSIAATDTLTISTLFERWRDSLRWDSPRFKGSIVMSISRELADSAATMLHAMTTTDHYERRAILMRSFGKNVKLVKLLVGRGANRWVDHAVWGDTLPSPTVAEPWAAARIVDGHILDRPEEPSDVADRLAIMHHSHLQRLYIKWLRSRFAIRYNERP